MFDGSPDSPTERIAGRYTLLEEIASGGMGSIHLGQVAGPGGFTRHVAIKRLHPELSRDPEATKMLLDEARLVARVRNVNVVSTLDVFEDRGEVYLVMEYVLGETVSKLSAVARRRGQRCPPAIASAIVLDVLNGLRAAHAARSPDGVLLDLVHRDISPQNVIVGLDGIARLLDFGIAKAKGRLHVTVDNRVRGKAAYMSPEQARGRMVDRRSDIFAAGVILWELLVGTRLFKGEHPAVVINQVIEHEPLAPTTLLPELPQALDAVLARALSKDPAGRYGSAAAFAEALEEALPPEPSRRKIAAWVVSFVGPKLEARARLLGEVGELPSTSENRPPGSTVAVTSSTSPGEDSTTATMAEAPPSGPTPLQRRRLGFAVLAVALLAAGLLVQRARSHPAPDAGPGVSPIAASVSVPALAVPTMTASTASVDLTAPVLSSTPPHSLTGTAPRSPRGAPPRVAGSAARPATKVGCDPPYRIDKDGILIPKLECL